MALQELLRKAELDGDLMACVCCIVHAPHAGVDTLMDHGLLDELRMWVHPFFIGSGGREDLLYQEGPLTRLNLVDTRTLMSGIVILFYKS
jgi:hypothetical protein